MKDQGPDPMMELVVDGDRRSIVTPNLRLALRWHEDRWLHAVEVGPSRTPVAWPIEGDPERDDPARVVSPAYQQLEFQERGGGHQALLVGQSGPHHFSAVFTVKDRDDEAEVEVDVADRCRSPVEALACTYFVDLVSGDLIGADTDRIEWGIPGGRLTFEALGPTRAQLSEAGRRATRVQATASLVAGAYTHRCFYRWRWSPDASP